MLRFSLSAEAVQVDAIVSIGFPLVGGPAGSMEAGRQVERNPSSVPKMYHTSSPHRCFKIFILGRGKVLEDYKAWCCTLPELDRMMRFLSVVWWEDIYLIPEQGWLVGVMLDFFAANTSS